MASNPNFVATANNGRARLTLANTTRDLSSLANAALLITAPATGSRIETIEWNHVAASQTQASIAATGRIFICDDAAGANPRMRREIALTAVTPSATVIGATFLMTFSSPILLKTGESLWCSMSVAQTAGAYDVICPAGDF